MICIDKKTLPTLSGLLLAGLLCSGAVEAAENSKDTITPVLLSESTPRKRNPAFAISTESVQKRLKKTQETLLIDVRDKKDFDRFRIPGSINIPLYAIKTKRFLEPKTLVLINEGYNHTQLERECDRLRRSGFRAWLLNGGLNAWREHGAPLEGDAFAQRGLNRIPPPDFFAEKNYDNWLVVNVSASENPEIFSLIPQSISIPANDEKVFISTFKSTIAKHKHNPLLSVLIFNETGEHYDRIEKAIQKAGFRNVFYLKGGIEAYRLFLERQVIIRQGKHKPKKGLKACKTCP